MAGTWFWMSGASETYDYWERNSFWGETSPCGTIATSAPFKWNDLPCGEHLHFICLKGEESTLLIKVLRSAPGCVSLTCNTEKNQQFSRWQIIRGRAPVPCLVYLALYVCFNTTDTRILEAANTPLAAFLLETQQMTNCYTCSQTNSCCFHKKVSQ